MMSKDPARRPQLLKFLELYKTQSGDATVAAVFGPTLKDTERDFHIYIDQKSYAYMAVPVKPAADPPQLQPAPAALVEASLGFLALGAGRSALAHQHADKAIALDANAPEGYSVLAYLARENRDIDQAVTHAEAALQRGAKDGDLFMLLGDSYMNGSNAQKPDARQARVNMYESAANLSPGRLAAYRRLTEALLAIEKPREEDGKFLAVGLRAFPGDDWLRLGMAAVDYRLGRREAGMTALDTVLRPESTLDEAQRNFATTLRRSWLVDAMNAEIDAAASNHDFAKARAVVARYRERIGNDAGMTRFMDEVDSGVELRELLDKYDAMVSANQQAEARALIEQLLARPNLPANLRSYFQQQLHEGK